MKLIKVSTPWNHIDYSKRIAPTLAGYRFFFDDSDQEFDYWIVWGGIKGTKESATCNPANIIYLTDEVHEERLFNTHFLNQFVSVITCRSDIRHNSIVASHELNTWMIDKDYEALSKGELIPKKKILSVVSSDQTWLPGHKLRFAFVNKMIGHFKDKLDVFGKGFNPVADKYDALAPYKYSIAIENSLIPGYFTEKLADCYLADTMPVYYGCPDIEKYFDKNSLLLIDPNDYLTAIRKIEQLVEEDPYDSLLNLIQEQKKKYLEGYHIFNKLVFILEQNFKTISEKTKITLKHERCFERGYGIKSFIDLAFNKFHIPGRLYFQISWTSVPPTITSIKIQNDFLYYF